MTPYLDASLKITWCKDSIALYDSDDRQIVTSVTKEGLKSALSLDSLEVKDAGLYTCTAENGFSRDEGTRKI